MLLFLLLTQHVIAYFSSVLLCSHSYDASSELIDYHVETFFSKNSLHMKKSQRNLHSLKSFLVKSFKSEEKYN